MPTETLTPGTYALKPGVYDLQQLIPDSRVGFRLEVSHEEDGFQIDAVSLLDGVETYRESFFTS